MPLGPDLVRITHTRIIGGVRDQDGLPRNRLLVDQRPAEVDGRFRDTRASGPKPSPSRERDPAWSRSLTEAPLEFRTWAVVSVNLSGTVRKSSGG